MGLLGISLLLVGITLISNGVNRFANVDAKSTAFMNLVTGILLITGNIIALAKAAEIIEYQNVASGFLFGITYIFIAANYLFNFDLRPFGWYCLFVAAYAVVMAVSSIGDYKFVFLWSAWAVLWGEGFLELAAGLKLAKIFPYISIAVGLFAAFIPSILMLTNNW